MTSKAEHSIPPDGQIVSVKKCYMRGPPQVGSGLVIPKKFKVPQDTDTPELLFPPRTNNRAIPPVKRFIRRTNLTELLIYTDGACLNNGAQNPQGGCAFVYKPSVAGMPGYSSFHLEKRGPTGELQPQTSNRAELRAVIAALRFRAWIGEGFKSLVIATDSEYVVEGATLWIEGWLRKGWTTSTGAPVKNKDLWQVLLGEFERWSEWGLEIKFWRIPRAWNTQADRQAKDAAAKGSGSEVFTDISGVLV